MDVSKGRRQADTNLKRYQQYEARYFAEKLDDIMNELDLSNAGLARDIHVDPSLISRIRKGTRMPSVEAAVLICEHLYKRTLEPRGSALICDRLGISPDDTDDRELFVRRLHEYFMSFPSEADNQAIDGFIERVGATVPFYASRLPSVEELMSGEIINEKKSTYHGLDGMRKAVLRFVMSVISSGRQQTLLAYSDQGMEWLLGDREYMIKCVSLILHALYRGNSIRIIHNLDRCLSEILNAINFWLPLYMTGRVETWCHRQSVRKRFSYTMFAGADDVVMSALVRGTESKGVYNYITGRDTAPYKEQFNALLEDAEPLMRLFAADTDSMINKKRGIAEAAGCTNRLTGARLPLETMSQGLFSNIAARLNPMERDALICSYERGREIFGLMLKAGGLTDFICPPDEGEIAEGKITIGTENAESFSGPFYTGQEYAAHLADTAALADSGAGYRLVHFKEPPFKDIRITAKREAGVLLQRDGDSPIVLHFTHSALSNAFFEYLNDLAEKVSCYG